MAPSRNPRSLKDVSHLFLSSAARPAAPEPPRAAAFVLVVAAGGSVARARIAAGAAAAFARLGTRVSVRELASNLPNVGYYFGLEPGEYLAPALNRRSTVAGAWNGSVRFASSIDLRSLARCSGGPPPGEGPHVLVAACTARPGPEPAFEIAGAIGAFAAGPDSSPAAPDAIVVAETGKGGGAAGCLIGDLRARWPGAMIVLLSEGEDPCCGGADERFAAPADFEAAAPLRSPPADQLFADLASLILQRLGSRRRRDERRSAVL